MQSLEARLEKLEQAKRTASERKMSDAELAVRTIWMLETKEPGWEKVAELLRESKAKAASKESK